MAGEDQIRQDPLGNGYHTEILQRSSGQTVRMKRDISWCVHDTERKYLYLVVPVLYKLVYFKLNSIYILNSNNICFNTIS